MSLYGFTEPQAGHLTWGQAVESLAVPVVVSRGDDEGGKRHQMLTDGSRTVGVVSKHNAPLQPGEMRGWFSLLDPGVVHSADDIHKVGWGQEFDPEFSSDHPIAVMKDGKVIAVVTTKELQIGT
jgi:hypothetical protein